MARITERITDPKTLILYTLRKIASMRDPKAARVKYLTIKAFAIGAGFGYMFQNDSLAGPNLPSGELEDAKKPLEFLPPPVSNATDFIKDLDKELKK